MASCGRQEDGERERDSDRHTALPADQPRKKSHRAHRASVLGRYVCCRCVCTEDEQGVEAELQRIAQPKPGTCCSKKTTAAAAAASAAANAGAAATSGECGTGSGDCCKVTDGTKSSGSCASSSSSSATATALSAAAGAAAPVQQQQQLLSGGVPPRRVKNVRQVGVRPVCQRCKACLANVKQRDMVNCTDCFTSLMASKIKSALRTKCVIQKGANVLLAVSGGAASTSVTHTRMPAHTEVSTRNTAQRGASEGER